MDFFNNGRAVSGREAEQIVNSGGSVSLRGNHDTTKIGESHPGSWLHTITLADGTQRIGGSAIDTIRIAAGHTS